MIIRNAIITMIISSVLLPFPGISADISYSLTPVSFEGDEYFLDPEQWESDAGWDTAHMMKNGCILIAHSRSRGMGLDYRDYYIKTSDGRDALPDDGHNFYRAVLETDDGRCFVTDMNGNTDVYDTDLEVIGSGLHFYHAYALDGGRYFAVDDEIMNDYSYARGVDAGPLVEKYALYRYGEKLTDCVYDNITPVQGGFLCSFRDENGTLRAELVRADDIVPVEKTLSLTFDETSGRYIYTLPDGENALDISFDKASPLVNSSAVVVQDGSFQILRLE